MRQKCLLLTTTRNWSFMTYRYIYIRFSLYVLAVACSSLQLNTHSVGRTERASRSADFYGYCRFCRLRRRRRHCRRFIQKYDPTSSFIRSYMCLTNERTKNDGEDDDDGGGGKKSRSITINLQRKRKIHLCNLHITGSVSTPRVCCKTNGNIFK